MGARVYLPTLGRFTQVDPVSGGNANDYVYAVDPINSNDFSGRFLLQGGAGAGSLQNAAGAVRVQPAAPAPYYQPAATFYTYNAPAKANSVVLRATTPAAKPRDNSTAMPVATVKLLPILADGVSQWKAGISQPSQASGYANVGGSFGLFGIGIAGGVKMDRKSSHPYVTFCRASAGAGISATMSSSEITTGVSFDVSGSVAGVAGSVSNDGSIEGGVALPFYPSYCAGVTYTW